MDGTAQGSMLAPGGALVNTRIFAFLDLVELGMHDGVLLFVNPLFPAPSGLLGCFGEN